MLGSEAHPATARTASAGVLASASTVMIPASASRAARAGPTLRTASTGRLPTPGGSVAGTGSSGVFHGRPSMSSTSWTCSEAPSAPVASSRSIASAGTS